MTALPLLTAALVMLGALLAYASAANQRLVSAPRPAFRWAGWVLLILALLVLLASAGTPAAIFTWLTFAMLTWSIAPLIAAWRHQRRTDER